MAVGSETRPVLSASARLSDFWSRSRLAGCRGEDAASVHVSCSIFLRQDGEAVVLVALEGAPHDAARGAGDPTRRGAACVAWETAGTQHSAGLPEILSAEGESGISLVWFSTQPSK